MEKVTMQGVPETMLQTLYARAAYSRQKNAKFHDPKAVEIVSRMDYDFSLAGKDAMMSTGVIARTILLDRMVGEFIRKAWTHGLAAFPVRLLISVALVIGPLIELPVLSVIAGILKRRNMAAE